MTPPWMGLAPIALGGLLLATAWAISTARDRALRRARWQARWKTPTHRKGRKP